MLDELLEPSYVESCRMNSLPIFFSCSWKQSEISISTRAVPLTPQQHRGWSVHAQPFGSCRQQGLALLVWCAGCRGSLQLLRPHADVPGLGEESSFNCGTERRASDGCAEAGATLWALLWQQQQERLQQDAVPRQAHGRGSQSPGGSPEPQGAFSPRACVARCIKVVAWGFF